MDVEAFDRSIRHQIDYPAGVKPCAPDGSVCLNRDTGLRQGWCRCGWRGPARTVRLAAQIDLALHRRDA